MKIVIKSKVLNRIINSLWTEWEVVLMTFQDQEYLVAKGKLSSAGIVHKTKVIPIGGGSGSMRMMRTYEIKVKKSDFKKAYDAIHY